MHIRTLLVAAVIAVAGLAVVPAAHADDVDPATIPAPTVTWPEQTNIGGDNPPYVVHVEDVPEGAGTDLWIARRDDFFFYTLDPHGDTEINLDGQDFTGPIRVYRCTPAGTCADTGVASPDVTVHAPPEAGLDVVDRLVGGTRHLLDVSVGGGVPGSYLVDWWVVEDPSIQETGVPVELIPPYATSDLVLDIGELPEGRYHVQIRLRQQIDGYGEVSDLSEPRRFEVDRTPPAPAVTSMSTDVIYPENDRYLDSVRLEAKSKHDRIHFEIADASGEVVRNIQGNYTEITRYWRGETDDGAAVAAGRYDVRVVAVDAAGNARTTHLGTVAVKPGHLVTRHTTLTVPAATSIVDTSVGACSELRRPASRGWARSLGYATNTRCTRGTKQSIALTVHRVRLPRAAVYGKVALGAYGGAAPSAPASRLRLELFSPDHDPDGNWLTRGLGQHWEPMRGAHQFLWGEHRNFLYWRAYTGGGAAYDLRSFSVRLIYQAIEV